MPRREVGWLVEGPRTSGQLSPLTNDLGDSWPAPTRNAPVPVLGNRLAAVEFLQHTSRSLESAVAPQKATLRESRKEARYQQCLLDGLTAKVASREFEGTWQRLLAPMSEIPFCLVHSAR